MRNMIDNLINGNLTDARKQAKRYSQDHIFCYLTQELGWKEIKARAAAYYLTTGLNFQWYCDSK